MLTPKPPIKLSDVSVLRPEVLGTDLLAGFAYDVATGRLVNASWSVQTVADFALADVATDTSGAPQWEAGPYKEGDFAYDQGQTYRKKTPTSDTTLAPSLDAVNWELANKADLTTTATATDLTVVSSAGTDAILPTATPTAAGVMSAADKAKLTRAVEAGGLGIVVKNGTAGLQAPGGTLDLGVSTPKRLVSATDGTLVSGGGAADEHTATGRFNAIAGLTYTANQSIQFGAWFNAAGGFLHSWGLNANSASKQSVAPAGTAFGQVSVLTFGFAALSISTTRLPYVVSVNGAFPDSNGNVTASTGGAAVLYAGTGQATDGAMTQKASTDVFAQKADLQGGQVPPEQLPIASNTQLGTVRNAATSGIRINSFTGALRNEAVFYTTETSVAYDPVAADPYLIAFGAAVALLDFPQVFLNDPGDTTRVGFVCAIRNTSATQVTEIVGQQPIDGQASVAVGPGQQRWIKFNGVGLGYDTVLSTGAAPVLTSPDGTQWKLIVNDAGVLGTQEL